MVRGPKFCPTTTNNYLYVKSDTRNFVRKLKLMEKFHDSTYRDESLVREPSNLDVKATNSELIKVITEIEKYEPECLVTTDNLPQRK